MEWIRMVKLEFILVFQLCVGPYETAGMIVFLIDKRVQIFAGYFSSCALDTVMGLPTPGVSAGDYGY
jgi:hypothetical protein